MIGSLVGVLGASAASAFRSSSASFSSSPETTCWVYFALAAAIYLGWMHVMIQRVMRGHAGEFMRRVEASH